MRPTTLAAAIVAALLHASPAYGHTIPTRDNHLQARLCHGTTTIRDFRRYARRTYRRDRISPQARLRIRRLHVCPATYPERSKVGQLHDRYQAARARRLNPPVLGGIYLSIRICESGNRYTLDTGNGFEGAYQFTRQTWAAYAPAGWGHVEPDHAPPRIQDAAAASLYHAHGVHSSASWPNCP